MESEGDQMQQRGENGPIELIKPDGTFNENGFTNFIHNLRELSSSESKYSVVCIIGPQSTGKSTLLNAIFGTNFEVLPDDAGMGLCTRGIWIAKGNSPSTSIVLDMEGSDGKENQDNTIFERQSGLFALIISDTIIVNMFHRSCGLFNAGSIPLFKLVFQQYGDMKREQQQKMDLTDRTTFLVILRDYNIKVPLDVTKRKVEEIIKETWDSVNEQNGQENAQFNDYFKIEVFTLRSAIDCPELFEKGVDELKGWFYNDAVNRVPRIPISDLCRIWGEIQSNPSFNFPTFMVIESNFQCERIAVEMETSLEKCTEYLSLKKTLDSDPGSITNFSAQVISIIESRLKDYRVRTSRYNEDIHARHQDKLKSKLFKMMEGDHKMMVNHIMNNIIAENVAGNEDLPSQFALTLEIFKNRCEEVSIPGAEYSYQDQLGELLECMSAHIVDSTLGTKIQSNPSMAEKVLKAILDALVSRAMKYVAISTASTAAIAAFSVAAVGVAAGASLPISFTFGVSATGIFLISYTHGINIQKILVAGEIMAKLLRKFIELAEELENNINENYPYLQMLITQVSVHGEEINLVVEVTNAFIYIARAMLTES